MVQQKALSQLAELQRLKHRAAQAAQAPSAADPRHGSGTGTLGSVNLQQGNPEQQAVAVTVVLAGTRDANKQQAAPLELAVVGIHTHIAGKGRQDNSAQHTLRHVRPSHKVASASMHSKGAPARTGELQPAATSQQPAVISQPGTRRGTGLKHEQQQVPVALRTATQTSGFRTLPAVGTGLVGSNKAPVDQQPRSLQQPQQQPEDTQPSRGHKPMPMQQQAESTQLPPSRHHITQQQVALAYNIPPTYGVLHTTHTFTHAAGPVREVHPTAAQLSKTQDATSYAAGAPAIPVGATGSYCRAPALPKGATGTNVGVPTVQAHTLAVHGQQPSSGYGAAKQLMALQAVQQASSVDTSAQTLPVTDSLTSQLAPLHIKGVHATDGQLSPATDNHTLDAGSEWHMHLAAASSHVVSNMEAAEHRTLARRRHRKRLAQIVVQHWKAVARPRLLVVRADRHYRQQLLGGALVALQSNVVAAAAGWRLAAIHAAKHTCLMLHHIVQAWHTMAQGSTKAKAAELQLRLQHQQRMQRAVLHGWLQWQTACVVYRKQQLQALFYYSFVTLTKVLREWQMMVVRHKHQATLFLHADSHSTRSLAKKAMQGWKEARLHSQHKRGLQQRADGWHRHRKGHDVLHAWRDLTNTLQQCRELAFSRLHAAYSSRQRDKAGRALKEWHALCEYRKELAGLLTHARVHMHALRVHACWTAWMCWAGTERELRLAADPTKEAWQCALAAGALTAVARKWKLHVWWALMCQAVEVSQHIRTGALRHRVLLVASFRMLCRYQQHHTRKRQLQAAWSSAVIHMRKRAVLRAWQQETVRQQWKAMAWQHAQDAHRAHVLRKCMHGWRLDVAYHRAKTVLWRTGALHCHIRLVRAAWRAWHAHHSWQAVKRDVGRWAQRGLMTTVLQAWHGFTQQQLHEEKQWRAAVRHRYLTLVSNVWAAFQHALQHAAEKCVWYQHVAHHYQLQLLARALHAWARLFLPQAAGARERAARAALHWRRKLLCVAFDGWVTESARLAIKYGREQQADAFATQCRMARTLLCWAEGIHIQRLGRNVKARQLAAAQQQLAHKQLARFFSAWVEVKAQLIVKHLQVITATSHWRQQVAHLTMRAWRAAMQRLHSKSQLLAKASLHWAQHSMLRAWPAWRQYTLLRKHKQAQAACALQHWHRSLAGRGLHALRWYAAYRSKKATDMQQALQLHRHTLLREGVSKWLEVGTWRATFRLQHLATTQARELAVKLALVEPYARHWRRVTHARIVSRAAASMPAAMAGLPMLGLPYMHVLPPFAASSERLWGAGYVVGAPHHLPARHIHAYPASPAATAAVLATAWPPLPPYMPPGKQSVTPPAASVTPHAASLTPHAASVTANVRAVVNDATSAQSFLSKPQAKCSEAGHAQPFECTAPTRQPGSAVHAQQQQQQFGASLTIQAQQPQQPVQQPEQVQTQADDFAPNTVQASASSARSITSQQVTYKSQVVESYPASMTSVRRPRPAPRLPAFLAQELAPLAGSSSPLGFTTAV